MTPVPIPRLLLQAWRDAPGRPVLRQVERRKLRTVTAAEMVSAAAAVCDRLAELGVGAGDRVLVLLQAPLDWLVADVAVLALGAVVIGVNPGFPDLELESALTLSPKAAVGWGPGLPRAWLNVPPAPGAEERWAQRVAALEPDMPAAITFTSGSTGESLPVLVSHRALSFLVEALPRAMAHGPDDAYLSGLPLHRVGSRQDFYVCLAAGIPYCGVEEGHGYRRNLGTLRPTVFWHTPRFFVELHQKLSRLSRPFPRHAAARLAAPLWRGSLRFAFACGASLPRPVEEDLRRMGLPVGNFYGMTEATSGISANLPGAFRPGTVGRPLPGLEVRFSEEGEVLLRGPSVMLGYADRPQLTAERVRNGWLHTGDLGELDGDGFLHLKGRLKNILVLANGRNVPMDLLERRIEALEGVRRALVVGEGRPEAGVLVVPDGAVSLPQLRWAVSNALADRPPHEQVHRVGVLARDFDPQQGEITSWGKVRRQVVLERFAAEIDALYQAP